MENLVSTARVCAQCWQVPRQRPRALIYQGFLSLTQYYNQIWHINIHKLLRRGYSDSDKGSCVKCHRDVQMFNCKICKDIKKWHVLLG